MTNSPVVGVVRRRGAEGLDVGAVAGLGHREAAHQLAGDEPGEVGLVVALGAELEDRAAEEAELDADLDQDAEVAEGEGLEGRDRGADVAAPAVLLGEAHAGLAGRRHLDHDVLDALAERGGVEGLGLDEEVGVVDEVGAHQRAHVGVPAVEQGGHRGDVDHGLHVARSGSPAGRRGLLAQAPRRLARWSWAQGSVARVNRPEPDVDLGRMPYNFSIVGRPEERHLDVVGDDQPAPPRVPAAPQGGALLQRRVLRLGAPRLRARLHRAAAGEGPHDGRRLHAGLPVLAQRAGADARLQARTCR